MRPMTHLLGALDHGQCLRHELLVDATQVGHLAVASVVHVHAACWGQS